MHISFSEHLCEVADLGLEVADGGEICIYFAESDVAGLPSQGLKVHVADPGPVAASPGPGSVTLTN